MGLVKATRATFNLEWSWPLGVLLLASLANFPVELAVNLLAAPFLVVLAREMWNTTYKGWKFWNAEWKEILAPTPWMAALMVFEWVVMRFSEGVALVLKVFKHADPNLTGALLVSILCLFLVSLVVRVLPEEYEDSKERAKAYKEVLWLACIALVPAALLANWAWNVLASVFLPLFYVAVKEKTTEGEEAEEKTTLEAGEG